MLSAEPSFRIGGLSLSTSELVALKNPALALFVPCKIPLDAKPERMIRVSAILSDGYMDSRYVCPDCDMIFVRRKSIRQHMGYIPDKVASCKIYHEEKKTR